MIDSDCVHDWGRLLSDPFVCRCLDCGVPFDQARHDPPLPTWEEVEAALGELFPNGCIVAPDAKAA